MLEVWYYYCWKGVNGSLRQALTQRDYAVFRNEDHYQRWLEEMCKDFDVGVYKIIHKIGR